MQPKSSTGAGRSREEVRMLTWYSIEVKELGLSFHSLLSIFHLFHFYFSFCIPPHPFSSNFLLSHPIIYSKLYKFHFHPSSILCSKKTGCIGKRRALTAIPLVLHIFCFFLFHSILFQFLFSFSSPRLYFFFPIVFFSFLSLFPRLCQTLFSM